jgi:hypothetical protein
MNHRYSLPVPDLPTFAISPPFGSTQGSLPQMFQGATENQSPNHVVYQMPGMQTLEDYSQGAERTYTGADMESVYIGDESVYNGAKSVYIGDESVYNDAESVYHHGDDMESVYTAAETDSVYTAATGTPSGFFFPQDYSVAPSSLAPESTIVVITNIREFRA